MGALEVVEQCVFVSVVYYCNVCFVLSLYLCWDPLETEMLYIKGSS